MNDLYENHTEEEIRTMVEAYVVATDGIYGDSEDSVRLYLEEILADQYSGMNRGGKEAARAREAVAGTAQRFAGDIENARQNRAGIERRNGPGFRFSAEEEAAMQEEGITVTSGPSALKKNQDNKSVSHVLAKNISNLEDMKPLAHLSGNEMNDKSKDLYTQIKEWFNSFGNKETREGFGTVLFDDYGVGGVMNHRPLNRAKLVTLMAAREIVKNGKQISYEPNWKGRGYDSFIFAGPVTVGPNNDLIYVAAVVDKQQDNKFYLNECVDSDGNYVRINESSPSSTKTGFTVQDGVTRGLGEPSKDSISQNKSKNNPVQEKINSREDSGEIDWIGNRDEDMSGKDRVYLQAVEEGRKDEAQWMVDEAAKAAGYSIKAWHGTPIKGITSFDPKKIGSATDDGLYGKGFYFSTNKVTADQYAKAGGKTMPVYLKADNPWWSVAHKDKAEAAEALGMDESAFTYSGSGISSTVVVPTLSQAAQFSSHLADRGYDSIVVQHGSNDYEVVVFDPEQVKSAEPVTYDDQGNVIPLSERFRADRVGSEEWKNRDIRFSPAEDDGEIGWIGKAQEDEKTDSSPAAQNDEDGEDGAPVGTTPHPSPAATPSPLGEGLGRQVAGATEEAEDGGRQMTAPTEDGGEIDWIGKAQEDEKTDSSTSPCSAQNDSGEDFEAMAREKKLALAEKVWKYGLYSACSGLCSTLVLYANPFFPVDSQYAEQRNQKIGLNLFQRQYKYEKACSVVLCPKFPVPGWAAADAGRAAALFPSGLRNKIPRFGKAIENQYGS